MRLFLVLLLCSACLPVAGQDKSFKEKRTDQNKTEQLVGTPERHIPLAYAPVQVSKSANFETPVVVPFLEGRISDINLVNLSGEELLMIYRDQVALSQPFLNTMGVKSMDNGQTWSSPFIILPAVRSGYKGSAISTASGRVLVIQQNGEPNQRMVVYSDDNGDSWTEPFVLPFPAGDGFDHKLSQTGDGTIWLFYENYNSDRQAWGIYYRTSTDDGLSWSSARLFVDGEDRYEPPTLVEDTAGTLTGLYAVGPYNASASLVKSTSSDGGATWSPPEPIASNPLVYRSGVRNMHVLHTPESDTIRVLYHTQSSDPLGFLNIDIHSILSSDNGQTWEPPVAFTRYIGGDELDGAVLVDRQPFILYNSSRYGLPGYGVGYWYGIQGITEDEAPPSIRWYTNNFERPVLFKNLSKAPAQTTFPVRAYVSDESQLSRVAVNYAVNGGAASEYIELYDDGLHDDVQAGDDIWGGANPGPFDIGDRVTLGFSATDMDGNVVTWLPGENPSVEPDTDIFGIEIIPAHTAGNILLGFTADGAIGAGVGSSLYWPAHGEGQDYLFSSSELVVGARVAGNETVVSLFQDTILLSSDSDISMGAGLADQDIVIPLSDGDSAAGTERPLGIDILQQSYQWSDSLLEDVIAFNYKIKNVGTNDLEAFTMGWYMDIEVPNGDHSDDLGGYDDERGLVYLYDLDSTVTTHIGITTLGAGMPLTARVVDRNEESDVFFSDRYKALTSGGTPVPSTRAGDYRLLIAADTTLTPSGNPGTLESGETVNLAFAIVMGESLEAIQQSTDRIRSLFTQLPVSIESPPERPGSSAELISVYPNPFEATATVAYTLEQPGPVTIDVYDLLGRKVATLVDHDMSAGTHRISFDGEGYSSGMYVLMLSTEEETRTKKVIVLR